MTIPNRFEQPEASKEQLTVHPLQFDAKEAGSAADQKSALAAAKAPGLESAQKIVNSHFDGDSGFQIVDSKHEAKSTTKTADKNLPNGMKEHDTFDSNGKKTSADARDKAGNTAHAEFDPANGNPKTLDVKLAHGAGSAHVTFDPKTGYEKSADLETKDLTEHREYDPKTGNQITAETKWADKSVDEDKFDPKTGKQTSSETINADGTIDQDKFDKSGKIATSDQTFSDQSTSRTQFTPDGKIWSMSRQSADGSSENDTYNPRTGKMTSQTTESADGQVKTTNYDAKGQKY
jgi:hypothetical protein